MPEMPQKQDAVLIFDSPEVIEERNRRIAELVGKKLEFSVGKTRDLHNTLGVLSKDSSPQKLVEFLYTKLWPAQSGIKREDIQKAITRCHEDAIGWLQNTHHNPQDN